jgi:hypothetical protein
MTVSRGGTGLRAADALCAGAPLTGDAWVARLRTPLEQAVAEEKAGYERGLAAGPKYPVWSDVWAVCEALASGHLPCRAVAAACKPVERCIMATTCEGPVLTHHPVVLFSHLNGTLSKFGVFACAQPGTEPDLGMRIQLVHGDEVRLFVQPRHT